MKRHRQRCLERIVAYNERGLWEPVARPVGDLRLCRHRPPLRQDDVVVVGKLVCPGHSIHAEAEELYEQNLAHIIAITGPLPQTHNVSIARRVWRGIWRPIIRCDQGVCSLALALVHVLRYSILRSPADCATLGGNSYQALQTHIYQSNSR